MEKFYYYSDLHNERKLDYGKNSPYRDDFFKFPKFEDNLNSNLILAGDIEETGKSGLDRYFDFLKEASSLYKRVFVVLGNHCHYGNSVLRSGDKLKEAVKELDNVYVLDNDSYEDNDFVVLGTTLWTDYNGGDYLLMDYSQDRYKGNVRDFRKIKWNNGKLYRKLKPVDVVVSHKKSLKWLESNLEKYKDSNKKMIVVSHHAPSFKSALNKIDQDLKISFDGVYASNLEWLIERYKPEYWIHGHVHKKLNYFIYNTNVLCNAFGYVGSSEVTNNTVNFSYNSFFKF